MGLKDWLAKNVAGVGAYGEVIGRESAKNGLALGRTLYLGHGTREGNSSSCVFADSDTMASEGFKLYCVNPDQMPPGEDSSKLSILTRAVGVVFASLVVTNTAGCFAKRENFSHFTRSVGATTMAYVKQNSPDVSQELILELFNMKRSQTVRYLLDFERPGIGDHFGVLLKSISSRGPAAVGFARTGILGFDTWALSLAQETAASIEKAAQEFRW